MTLLVHVGPVNLSFLYVTKTALRQRTDVLFFVGDTVEWRLFLLALKIPHTHTHTYFFFIVAKTQTCCVQSFVLPAFAVPAFRTTPVSLRGFWNPPGGKKFKLVALFLIFNSQQVFQLSIFKSLESKFSFHQDWSWSFPLSSNFHHQILPLSCILF